MFVLTHNRKLEILSGSPRTRVTSSWGASVAVPFVGALDAFPPDLAWSHRRALVSSFEGNILQARRVSDDEPYDVARLANGDGDIAGLQTFVGGGSATVAALTEQMGTGVHFVQTTADYQRTIIDSGTLVTVGGMAASKGTRTGDNGVDGGKMAAATTYTGTVMSLFIRGRTDALSGWFAALAAGLCGAVKGTTNSGLGQVILVIGPTDANGISVRGINDELVEKQPYETDYLISLICDGSTVTFRDGTHTYTHALTQAFDVDKFILGGIADSDSFGAEAVKLQELAIYYSDQTSNEAAIRSALLA